MEILEEVTELLKKTDIPIETSVFSDSPPNQYLVLTPMNEWSVLSADNDEVVKRQEVRISLFSKPNYIKVKNEIVRLLKEADFILTDRRYIGREDDTGYHNFAIDTAKDYLIKEE